MAKKKEESGWNLADFSATLDRQAEERRARENAALDILKAQNDVFNARVLTHENLVDLMIQNYQTSVYDPRITEQYQLRAAKCRAEVLRRLQETS